MSKSRLVVVLGLFFAISLVRVSAQTVLVEAESLSDLGGWVVDQQAMNEMGSAYILAHGMGTPVKDATTKLSFPSTGTYQVWVRTRNWVASWGDHLPAPGKFQLLVNGKPLDTTFGTEGEKWHWQNGGTVEITDKEAQLAIHDLTGFEGRCDAILFTTDSALLIPNDGEEISAFRNRLLGFPREPEGARKYDLVVVGGGMAGCCTAISAARLGLQVALLQNREVLGGNNSSEVRVQLLGGVNLPPYPALGNVVAELDPVLRGNVKPASFYDDPKKLRVVKNQKNLHLFLNTHAFKVEKTADLITAIIAKNTRTGRDLLFKAPLFVDCTGDGTIGFLAGADSRMGRESREQTQESMAPEKADNMIMGMSVQWYSRSTDKPTSFPDCPWAVQFTQESCQPVFRGEWDWEAGMSRDQAAETEFIRDYSFRVIYGNWAFMKNHSKQKKNFLNKEFDWMAYIGGKRESRRLMGDVILTQQDMQNDIVFPDAFITPTWSLDLHFPHPDNTKFFPNEEFRSSSVHSSIKRNPIPYRCLYSRNIPNLMMAGRNISVTHVALGSTRVMRTCGMMGELVGMAASVCKKYDILPRAVYADHLDELKALAKKGIESPKEN